MQAHPPGAATDVEDAAADEPHSSPLHGVVPARERRDEVPRVERHHVAVVTLDDLHRAPPGEDVLEDRAPDVPVPHALILAGAHGRLPGRVANASG